MATSMSGTVTFLFTDVEGSTRLLRQLRDGYGEVLAEHQRILRSAFAAANGTEIDTQGDSFFVAFRRPREAILAAVESQRELAAQDWPGGVRLRVRMGIHTGQAEVADGRYIGLAVHRAARIAGVAHGGQILVSQTTQSLLEADEDEPEEIGLRGLGVHQLKDFDRPVALFQVEAPELAGDFPPLRLDAAPAELGTQPVESVEAPPRIGLVRRGRLRLLVAGGALLVAVAAAVAVMQLLSGNSETQTPAPVEVTRNSLAEIDPRAARVAASIPVGTSPSGAAVVGDAVWTVNRFDETVTIYRPETGSKNTVPARTEAPEFVVADGSDGAWVLGTLSPDIHRIDAQTLGFRRVHLDADAGPATIAAGSLWIAPSSRRDLFRVRRRDGHVRKVVNIDCERPSWMANAPTAIWISCTQEKRIIEVRTADHLIQSFPVPETPTGIAFGFGHLWVATESDGSLRKLDPRDGSVLDVIKLPGGVESEFGPVAAGAEAVWVGARGLSTVFRVDPETAAVTPIKLGADAPPLELAIGLGAVWVAV